MPSQLIHRHDQYFKRLLDQPGTAAALLRERLPPGLAARLTDDPPERLPTSFISDELDESRTDRLYRTQTRDGTPVLAYTLVEHKSAPDHRIGLQLLGYRTRILKWWDDAEGRSQFVRFVLREPNELQRCIVREVLAEVAPGKENSIMSIALQEWQQEWKAQGRADGLLRLMHRKFGSLSEDVEQRVQAATMEDLDRWYDAILEAATLEELFSAPKH